MPSLVLFSGGMDSTVALFHTLHRVAHNINLQFQAEKNPGSYHLAPVHCLYVDYGQRHYRELRYAKLIYEEAKKIHPTVIGQLDRVYLSGLPPYGSLLNRNIDVLKYYGDKVEGHDDPAFIPHRNLMFLSFAAMWGRYRKATEIVTGIRGGFPDCTEQFEQLVGETLRQGDPNWPFVISSPVHMSRAETIKLALSIPGCWDALGMTMTCFEGAEPPCGHCLPCVKRAEGFAQLCLDDPLLVRLGFTK